MRRKIIATALTIIFATGVSSSAGAVDEQELVDEAEKVVESMKSHPEFTDFEDLLDDAHGAIIVPSLIKAGFIVGGEGGRALMLVRDPATNEWSYPAFQTMATGSIGLQIGVQVSEVVFLVLNQDAVEKLVSDKVKLGADAGITVATLGAGVEGATTTNLDVDVVAYARGKGLFGGISLEGAVLTTDDDRNQAYYNKSVSVRGILFEDAVSNPGAEALRSSLQPSALRVSFR